MRDECGWLEDKNIYRVLIVYWARDERGWLGESVIYIREIYIVLMEVHR